MGGRVCGGGRWIRWFRVVYSGEKVDKIFKFVTYCHPTNSRRKFSNPSSSSIYPQYLFSSYLYNSDIQVFQKEALVDSPLGVLHSLIPEK